MLHVHYTLCTQWYHMSCQVFSVLFSTCFVENACGVPMAIYFLICFALQQESIYSSDSRVQRQYPQPTFFSVCDFVMLKQLLYTAFPRMCVHLQQNVEQQDSGAALCVHFEKMSVIDLPLFFTYRFYFSYVKKRPKFYFKIVHSPT